MTYVPPQDQHRLFLNRELGELVDCKSIPQFTFDSLLRKARTVDVIWFNERNMPILHSNLAVNLVICTWM